MKAVTAIKINAGNDTNGNPRRAFVVLSNGSIVEAIDEGYNGDAALHARYPNLYVSAHIYTTPKEYRDMLKTHSSKGTKAKRNPVPLFAEMLKAHAASVGTGMKRNPKRRTAAMRVRKTPAKQTKIAMQAQLAGSLWATINTYSDTMEGKKRAIADAKETHRKIPNQAMRVIKVKR